MADSATVAAFYGRIARVYDLVATHTPWIGALRSRTAEVLDLEPGDVAVEMGCGTGANLPYLRERVGSSGAVVGVDLTPGMLSLARRRVNRAGWRNVHLVCGDAARPPIGAADAVLATFVVGMLDDPGAAVDRWCDLVSGGRVALLDATRSPVTAARRLDPLFRAFVTLTTPPWNRLRYAEPPAMVLDQRVAAARETLERRGTIVTDERRALGFVRMSGGRIR